MVPLLLTLLVPRSNPVTVYHLDPSPHSPKPWSTGPQSAWTSAPAATVAADPRGRLPDQFSICASFFVSLWTPTAKTSRAGGVKSDHLVLEIRGTPSPREYWAPEEGLYVRTTHVLEYSTMKNTGFAVTETAVKALYRFSPLSWPYDCCGAQVRRCANGAMEAYLHLNRFGFRGLTRRSRWGGGFQREARLPGEYTRQETGLCCELNTFLW